MMTEWLARLVQGRLSKGMKNTAFPANILGGLTKTTGHDLIHPGQRMKGDRLRDRAVASGGTTGRGHRPCTQYTLRTSLCIVSELHRCRLG